MNFDEIIDRRGTHSGKWDDMERYYGVAAADGIPMWVADMDFRPPQCVRDALAAYLDGGVFGYFGDDAAYRAAVTWWMQSRHGWTVDPDAIFTTHGLVNGAALVIDTFSAPGDGVVLTTPEYHAFARIALAADRQVIECEFAREGDRYVPDFAAWDAMLPANARILLLCSPHNPGGRVWTAEELRGFAEFARRHDLILVSDEIHHDLVMPGHRHLTMALAAPDVLDRLIVMTATTKTFNIAGSHSGNVIIPDTKLRAAFARKMMALGISPNSFGLHMATAAYSPAGAEWVDALNLYLDGNRRIFEAGMNAIAGLRALPVEATYLTWIDFSGTGMTEAELDARIEGMARIAASKGATFGKGGALFRRFNIATPRARVVEAVSRIQAAFADLQ